MDFLSILKLLLDLTMLFVLGFSFGTPTFKFKKYCYIILGSISIILALVNSVQYNFILSLIYSLLTICWFILSIICKQNEDKFLK